LCDKCGEGINFRRELRTAGQTLCIPCGAAERQANGQGVVQSAINPPVLLIVGFKKVGKTRLMERLVTELSGRGHRIACIN
jgi:polynucleotide 5'-kinase involved in rRNA processing